MCIRDRLILMFQKEVAERIMAKAQTKEYNRLAVLSNWRLEIKKHFDVSKNCFFPKPKINSTLLSFKPKRTNILNIVTEDIDPTIGNAKYYVYQELNCNDVDLDWDIDRVIDNLQTITVIIYQELNTDIKGNPN